MTTARRRLIREAERVNPVAPVHIWRSPAGAGVDMLVVAHLSAYSAIHQHATESLPNETGGFLIGRVAYDGREKCWHLEIEQAIPVEPATQNPTHFTFTWRDVDRIRSYREEHGKALLGWYHTHPDLPIFLSETDLEKTHRVLFSEPFQIALVYDPVRSCAGYFFWEGAQQIDATRAAWREFEIAVSAEVDDSEDTPPNGLPAVVPTAAIPAAGAEPISAPAMTPTATLADTLSVGTAAAAAAPQASADLGPPPPIAAPTLIDAPPPPPPPPPMPITTTATPMRDSGERLSSSDTHHRLRLSPPEGRNDQTVPIRAARPGADDDETPIVGRRTVGPPPSRSITPVLVLVTVVLVLVGLVVFAYVWFAPPQG
jgi:proteasome lid subunit RPN8/RPN11